MLVNNSVSASLSNNFSSLGKTAPDKFAEFVLNLLEPNGGQKTLQAGRQLAIDSFDYANYSSPIGPLGEQYNASVGGYLTDAYGAAIDLKLNKDIVQKHREFNAQFIRALTTHHFRFIWETLKEPLNKIFQQRGYSPEQAQQATIQAYNKLSQNNELYASELEQWDTELSKTQQAMQSQAELIEGKSKELEGRLGEITKSFSGTA